MPLSRGFVSEQNANALLRESVLFIGTRFSNLYTAVDSCVRTQGPSRVRPCVRTHEVVRQYRQCQCRVRNIGICHISVYVDIYRYVVCQYRQCQGEHDTGQAQLSLKMQQENATGWREVTGRLVETSGYLSLPAPVVADPL